MYAHRIKYALQAKNPALTKQECLKYTEFLSYSLNQANDYKTGQNMMKTVNSIHSNLKNIDPNKDCSCDYLKKIIKGSLFAPSLIGGYYSSFFIGFAEAMFRTPAEGLSTAKSRLDNGDIVGTATGLLAGGVHGLTSGGINGAIGSLRIPGQVMFGPGQETNECQAKPQPHCAHKCT